VERMDLETALNAWMDEHEGEILDLLDQEMERFRAAHPGIDEAVAEIRSQEMGTLRRHLRCNAATPRYSKVPVGLLPTSIPPRPAR
jgi:hypothetical protein